MRIAALAAAVVGAAGSVAQTVGAGARNPSRVLIGLFVLWVLSPFAALAVANWISKTWSELTRVTLYVMTFGLAIGSVFVYGVGASRMRIGKSAVIFVITAPISWLIAATALGIAALVSRRHSRRHVP
jgi:hypothetical protein